MRIGLDLRLGGTHEGGIAEYARQLARWLPSVDERRDYVPFGRRGKTPPDEAREFLWTPPHHRFERTTLRLELMRHKLDLFHSPDFVPPRRGRYRRVITVQDLAFLTAGAAVPEESRRYYGRWIRTAVAEADAIIAISHATKNALVDELGVPSGKITVTHLGRDDRLESGVPTERENALRRLGLEPGYILSVASFEWRKNHIHLLEAYRLLRSLRKDTPPLVLVGYRGPTLAHVRFTIHDLGLEQHVLLFVDLPKEDLPSIYGGARLFTMLSLDEGFGLPLVDAMACGLPSVVSRRGALPEIAAGAALEVDPSTIEDAVEALVRLLDDVSLCQRLAARARKRSRAFSWEKTARETLAVYDELLGAS